MRKIDKLVINTSGVGLTRHTLTSSITTGDKIILSGGIGEHAVALLSKRFDYETTIVTDSKPLLKEMNSIKNKIKAAKDPTRGGIASSLNEIAARHNVGMIIDEEKIPIKKEVSTVVEMLGLNPYELASEGRFICICAKDNGDNVKNVLLKYNPDASIIGEITTGKQIILKTMLGKRILPKPSGRIVPRIC